MLVLTSSDNNAVIYSGLIAAIVSGIVSLIGYSITAYIQNKNNKETLKVQKENSSDAIKTQKEIAKMGHKEKLFYESQLEWSNEVRKLITKFVLSCQKLNSLRKGIEEIRNDNRSFSSHNPDELEKEYQSKVDSLKDLSSNIEETIYNLQNTTTLIRLYLFHIDNSEEKKLINVMYDIVEHSIKDDGRKYDSHELDIFIELARKFFDKQMKELQNKIA
ncbi:hypothetical protein [Limosilactobacillus reuteri]|uniref:Uncharacterized protein n=1 Tax=Limosilactobacillus reuteri subsp. rodentium (strain DSM 17509 / CIP 109821 / 100-23) TaxID=349123 RepID=B3XNC7_LIMR1|nr:hypothetical protein [Limosilactobacillus reuteri]EDX42679.1 hypothetical protein Lreu23DRAFT_4195 [Limosilactobacillus reuteri subsp. rodentium]MCC4474897.1 hypothetical protein [Limosilactobacillus reuteri]